MVAWPGVTRASSLIFPNTEREVKPLHRDLCLIGGRMYGLSLSTVRLRKMMAMICISERKRCVVHLGRRRKEKRRQNKPKHMSTSSPEILTYPDPNRGPGTKLQDFGRCVVRRETQEKRGVHNVNVVVFDVGLSSQPPFYSYAMFSNHLTCFSVKAHSGSTTSRQ